MLGVSFSAFDPKADIPLNRGHSVVWSAYEGVSALQY